jgi:hypothetical protein
MYRITYSSRLTGVVYSLDILASSVVEAMREFRVRQLLCGIAKDSRIIMSVVQIQDTVTWLSG